ncbi:unnamed protein product [Penicillium pancosmium]
MAHIQDLAALIKPAYAGGRKLDDRIKFPETGAFQGMNGPSRFEGDIFQLEIDGAIPPEISGTFYRIQPDHRFPPQYEDDIHFNGDGNITAIRIEGGNADFKQRYAKTDRYLAESTAKKSLFGRYRNPYTDNEAVKGVIRTAANTNIIFWRGMLLATKEDGPPYAMDPVTLETIGRYDFDGQVQSPTFTAHPKIDPETGELVCFGYEAGGNGNDGSCDIVVYTISAEGKKTEEAWYKAPFCGMIHDCGISKNYVILPMTPLKCNTDSLEAGGNHWAWDPNEDQWYGIVPRRGGKPEDIVWLRSDNAFHGHVAGCYENEDGKVVFDLTVADGNVFFFFPPEDAPHTDLAKRNVLQSPTCRWIFDPQAPTGSRVQPEVQPKSMLLGNTTQQLADRRLAGYSIALVITRGTIEQKTYTGLGHGQPLEPTLIPKEGGTEGEGWIIALFNHLDKLRNDIVILDALNVAAGPVAAIHLPFKLRLGLHGNFVDQRDIDEWKKRRATGGDVGPVKAAEKPLKWQLEELQK